MDRWNAFLKAFFNLEVMATYFPLMLQGLGTTLLLAVLIVISGIGLGLVLAMIRAMRYKPVNVLIIIIADVFRSLPPLVLIIVLFFGLPNAGIAISGFAATWLSLTLVLMAFSEELFWANIRAVDHGQSEAAWSTGLNETQTLIFVVVPQAMRASIPALTNRTIATVKGTALASVVGVAEILGAAESGLAYTSNPSPLTLGALMYLLLFFPLIRSARFLEKRWAMAHKRNGSEASTVR